MSKNKGPALWSKTKKKNPSPSGIDPAYPEFLALLCGRVKEEIDDLLLGLDGRHDHDRLPQGHGPLEHVVRVTGPLQIE
jgi:hypothetical protein